MVGSTHPTKSVIVKVCTWDQNQPAKFTEKTDRQTACPFFFKGMSRISKKRTLYMTGRQKGGILFGIKGFSARRT